MSKTTAIESPFLTSEEARAYLNVTKPWLARAVYERRIPVQKMGNLNYFRKADLDAWLDANYRPAASDSVEWE